MVKAGSPRLGLCFNYYDGNFNDFCFAILSPQHKDDSDDSWVALAVIKTHLVVIFIHTR